MSDETKTTIQVLSVVIGIFLFFFLLIVFAIWTIEYHKTETFVEFFMRGFVSCKESVFYIFSRLI